VDTLGASIGACELVRISRAMRPAFSPLCFSGAGAFCYSYCYFLSNGMPKISPKPLQMLVPVEGLEPPTFGLQNRCSTS
jgi:hypothetical protein